MRFLQLQPHVSFALVDERPVFLDVRRDRYLALDGESEKAFLQAREARGAIPGDEAAAKRLLETGLFAEVDEPQRLDPAPDWIPPVGSPVSSRSPRPLDVVAAWVHVARARRAIGTRPLDKVLAGFGERRGRIDATRNADEVERLCARFRAARALVPISPSCLHDSLALGAWLARRGGIPSIVFGVKLDPFAAHCWIQSEHAVLNDAPDKVAEFTPILVLS